MKSKRLVLVSGLIGPLKSSNQSFTNTVKGYLENGFEVYHFAFYSRKNRRYDLQELLEHENYKFFGVPNFISQIVNGRKRKKGNTEQDMKIPMPNEIVKPEAEITKLQFFFKVLYDIFESVRLLIVVPFLKPDVIYSYEIYGVNPGYLISKVLHKPLIKRFQGTFIDSDNIDSKRTLFHKKVYEKDCALNIMANDGTKGDLVLKKLGFSDDKILFLLNGLDERIKRNVSTEEIDKKRKELNLDGKDLVLGIFNRFYPFKRIDRAVYLLRELKERIPNPYLLVGGMGGPTEQIIKEYVIKNGLENNVAFLGGLDYDNVIIHYHLCDVILILNDYANTGNQLLEAAYLGKQVIATDDGNNSKILRYDNIHYVRPDKFLEEAVKIALEIYQNKDNFKEQINTDILTWKERMEIELSKVNEVLNNWRK